MAVARPADLGAARGVVVALPAPETGTASAEPRSRAREKFTARPAGPLRKRPPPFAGPSSSRPPAPPRKKARDVPGISFSICHGCRVDTGSTDSLEVLESKWRALLLCLDCLRAVQAREACAYCFVKFSTEDPRRRVIDCVDCGCRVHLVCIPGQRGFITPYDLDPSVFSCVDCCAIPLYFQPPRDRCPKTKCSPEVINAAMSDLVRDANAFLKRKAIVAELAKQKAMDKAEAAKLAADQARDAFDLALLASQGSSSSFGEPLGTEVADEELALKLHLAMNGSQRISRSQPSLNQPNPLSNFKRVVPNGHLTGQRLGPDKNNLHEVKVWLDNSSHANMDALGAGPVGITLDGQQPLSPFSNSSCRIRDESVGKEKIIHRSAEEPIGSQDKVLNPSADHDGADSECLSASSMRSDGSNNVQVLVEGCIEGFMEESSAVPVQLTTNAPDRYLKKYSRNNKLRRNPDNKGITKTAPVLGPCSSCSNSSRDYISASFDASLFTMDASANVSGSSGCQ